MTISPKRAPLVKVLYQVLQDALVKVL